MQVQVWQAALFGLLACLASMPGLGGTVLGNYTLGRPLVAGLIVGLIMGDVQTGIYLGAAIQVVYIALVTPGGTVSADDLLHRHSAFHGCRAFHGSQSRIR